VRHDQVADVQRAQPEARDERSRLGRCVVTGDEDVGPPIPRPANDSWPPTAIAARLAETAREAGAVNPEELGEQLALLIDGASARTRVLNSESFSTAAAIAAVLIDNAIPASAPRQTGSAAVPVAG
jgi:hypothetical protein